MVYFPHLCAKTAWGISQYVPHLLGQVHAKTALLHLYTRSTVNLSDTIRPEIIRCTLCTHKFLHEFMVFSVKHTLGVNNCILKKGRGIHSVDCYRTKVTSIRGMTVVVTTSTVAKTFQHLNIVHLLSILPVQDWNPSPLYPVLQLHWYPPGMLLQVAWLWHSTLFSAHSSISTVHMWCITMKKWL